MSDTLRSLPPRGAQRPSVRRSRIWRRLRQAVVILLLVVAVHGFWVTRDTTPFTELIPAEQQYGLFLSDIMARRDRIADSFIWEAAPEQITGRVARLLQAEPALPDWVVHNLISSTCYLAGNDLEHFEDILILSRMSHVGTLLERYARLGPWTQRDRAGGLNLRRLPGAGLYYAVRGRTLALSPSRDALIRALTLRPEDMISAEHYETTLERSGLEDAGGVIMFEPGDPMAEWLHTVGFAARAEPAVFEARARLTLSEDMEDAWAPILNGLTASALLEPPAGMAGLSINVNAPLEEVLARAAEAAGWDWPPAMLVPDENEEEDDNDAPTFPWIADLIGPAGPAVTLSIIGFAPYDITPMPILALLSETNGQADELLGAIPHAPEDARPWESYPRRSEDSPFIHIPAIGGPAFEPALASVGGHLLVTSSHAEAGPLLERGQLAKYMERQGNLYLRIEPTPLIEAIVETGRQLAEMEMLKGHDATSFAALAEEWSARAGKTDHAEMLLVREGREILVELRVVAEQQNAAGPRTQTVE